MRLAVIPPPSLMYKLPQGALCKDDYHLIIPAFCRDPDYVRFYQEDRRGFKIMDNGAAEDIRYDPVQVLSAGLALKVNEVVLPDEIGDADKTMKMVMDCLQLYASSNFKPRLMAVVQGNTLEEAIAMIAEYSAIKPILTIGIPRHLLSIQGDARGRLINYTMTKYPRRFQIHLLGMHHMYPYEIVDIQKAFGNIVRGVDTSMPFNYARYGLPVSDEHFIKRPADYSTYEWDHEDMTMAVTNIEVMRKWANGA